MATTAGIGGDAIIVHGSEFKALVLNIIVKTNTGANVRAPFFRVSFSKDKGRKEMDASTLACLPLAQFRHSYIAQELLPREWSWIQ